MAQSKSSEAKTGYTLVSPPAIYTMLMLAAPLATVLIYSVLTNDKGSVGLPLTIDNYWTVATKPIFRYSIWLSVSVSMIVTLVTVLLAYPVAYFVSFHVKPDRKSMWLFLITIPFWTSYIIRVCLWFVILGYKGIVDNTLMSMGILDQPLNIASHGVLSIVIVLAHAYAPFAVLPIFVSLEKVDRSLLEAGQDLGESRLMTFLRVTLPLTLPGVIAAVLIVFIPTVGDYVTPTLIGDGKVPMIATLMESQLLTRRNFALGSAAAVVSMAMVAIVSIAFVLISNRLARGAK